MRGPCNPTTKPFGVRPNEEGLQQGPHPHRSLPPFPPNPPKRRGVYHHFTTPPHTFFYVIPSTLGEEALGQYCLQDTEGKGRILRSFHDLDTLGGWGVVAGRRHSTNSNKVLGHTSITWFVLRLRTSTQSYSGLYSITSTPVHWQFIVYSR